MNEPLAVALKFGFLAVLYLFLLWIARAELKDMRRRETLDPLDAPEAAPRRRRDAGAPDLRAAVEPRLEVVAAAGLL